MMNDIQRYDLVDAGQVSLAIGRCQKGGYYLVSDVETYIAAERQRIIDELVTPLMEAAKRLRRKHTECEDQWYSCPKSPGGCANDSEGDRCNCGADLANVAIDKALAAVSAKLKEIQG